MSYRSSFDLASSSSDSLSSSPQKEILNEVLFHKKNNMDQINKRRVSFNKKQLTPESIEIDPFLHRLSGVYESISPSMSRIISRASTAPGRITHVKKKSTDLNNSGFTLTVSADGRKFVHVPKSTFAYGGGKEVKVAIDADSQEVVVATKEVDDLYFGPNTGHPNKLHKVQGDIRVKERCDGCINLAIGYAFTARDTLEDGCCRRYIYSVMKYYQGGDLDGKYFNGKEFYHIAIGLAKGLLCMHRAGLVHRDIKPENMYYDNGIPVLADFGTVSAEEDIHRASEKTLKVFTRMTDGTSAYKPPETCFSMHHVNPFAEGSVDPNEYYNAPLSFYERHDPLEFAKKGDVFSFGLSLLQISRPISGPLDSRRVRHQKLLEASQKFRRDGNPGPGLDKLIYKMLKSNPADRSSMDHVLIELQRLGAAYTLTHVTLGGHRFLSRNHLSSVLHPGK